MQVGGAVAALGSAQLDWRVHSGLESFPQVGASEPLASSLLLLTIMLYERAKP